MFNIPRAMIFENFVATFESNFVGFEVVENFRYFLGHICYDVELSELGLRDAEHQQMLVFLIWKRFQNEVSQNEKIVYKIKEMDQKWISKGSKRLLFDKNKLN